MNITATAVAVTLAVVIAVAFLFFGPNVLRPFGTSQPATVSDQQYMATSSDSMNPNQPQGAANPANPTTGAAQAAPLPNPLPTTLTLTDEVIGTGAEAKAGDTVTVQYVGMLPNGQVFDASSAHAETKAGFTFHLGAGQVIKGWDQGVAGMKVGGKRRLIIPPDMGYGAQGAGNVIPPNATLIFEVELVKVGQ